MAWMGFRVVGFAFCCCYTSTQQIRGHSQASQFSSWGSFLSFPTPQGPSCGTVPAVDSAVDWPSRGGGCTPQSSAFPIMSAKQQESAAPTRHPPQHNDHQAAAVTSTPAATAAAAAPPQPAVLLLPWMRVPLSISEGCGVQLADVQGLHPSLMRAVQQQLGFVELFPVQAAVWRGLAGGHSNTHDMCICAPTGSGKTLAYALPMLNAILTG